MLWSPRMDYCNALYMRLLFNSIQNLHLVQKLWIFLIIPMLHICSANCTDSQFAASCNSGCWLLLIKSCMALGQDIWRTVLFPAFLPFPVGWVGEAGFGSYQSLLSNRPQEVWLFHICTCLLEHYTAWGTDGPDFAQLLETLKFMLLMNSVFRTHFVLMARKYIFLIVVSYPESLWKISIYINWLET